MLKNAVMSKYCSLPNSSIVVDGGTKVFLNVLNEILHRVFTMSQLNRGRKSLQLVDWLLAK